MAFLIASACGSTDDTTPSASTQAGEPEPEPEPAPPPSRSPLRHKLSSSCRIHADELSCWTVPYQPQDAPPVIVDAKPVSVAGDCVLLDSGAVVCMEAGRLEALEGVSALASSDIRTCGVVAGEVLCIEADGKRVIVRGIIDAVDLALFWEYGCALRSAGTVTCWERPSWPNPIDGVTDAVEISVHVRTGCVRTEAGEVICWENNSDDSSNVIARRPATKIEGIEHATAIAAGTQDSCAVVDGAVLCWGNSFDEPTRQPGIEGAVELVIGDNACALLTNGQPKCWTISR